MISFELGEELQLIQETARRFAAERLFPRIRESERDRGFPAAIEAEAHELGLGTIALPESAGGGGLGLLAAVVADEQIAWGDAGACFGLAGPGALGPFVLELGSDEQKREVLSRFTSAEGAKRRGAVAWTEARPAEREGFATTAKRDGDGWVITGAKHSVVDGGRADRYVVFAQVDADAGWRGIGAFVVPGDAKGVSGGERKKLLGLDAAYVADVRFDEVRVPATARLEGGSDFPTALTRAFARHALRIASRAVGVASRAWELTHAYAHDRKAFGKPIGHFQAVAFTVADRLMDVESARWMIWRAAADWDRKGEPRLADVAGAAAHALEMAIRCADDGVQLHGGAGFMRDFPIEKLLRDARQIALMTASTSTLDGLAADVELGRAIDPASILPTPDIQPVIL